MKKPKDRVIIDTNVWIWFLLQKNSARLDRLVFRNDIILLFSDELLQEFLTVVKRAKFRRYFNMEDVADLLEKRRSNIELITVSSQITVCRDPKDNFLLSLAVDSSASHLITGDADLLVLRKIENTTILTIADFLSGYENPE